MNSKKNVFTNSEDKWDFIIAIIVIVLFSVFIYQFLFKTENKTAIDTPIELNEFQKKTTLKSIDETENSSVFLDKNSNKYKKKTIKAEDAYQSNIDSATIISDFVKIAPIKIETDIKTSKINSITTSVITDTLNISNIETNIDNKENTNVSKEVSIKKQEQKEVIKTTTATKINVVKKANEYSNAKNSSYNCVIVIGVFREASNTKAIINKLQAIGYPYVEGALREGISYVGVPVACNDKQKKQELLKELNKTFGIRSWIKKI